MLRKRVVETWVVLKVLQKDMERRSDIGVGRRRPIFTTIILGSSRDIIVLYTTVPQEW